MKEPQLLFQGNVRVYLQGRKALFPFDIKKHNQMKYYIGSNKSRLIIKDKRKKPLEAAKKILAGEQNILFKEYFNNTAYVKILKNYRGIIIEMDEVFNQCDTKILWMGVLHEKKMPVHKITWYILKPVDQQATAFAAIVED